MLSPRLPPSFPQLHRLRSRLCPYPWIIWIPVVMKCIRSLGIVQLGGTGASAVDDGHFCPNFGTSWRFRIVSLYQTDILISSCALAQINLVVLVADKTRISED